MDGHLRRRWRWVWYVVGVLIAGCNSTIPTMRSPATLPTLPGYTLIPPTLTPIPRLVRTPVRMATLGGAPYPVLPLSTPHPLALGQPACTETPVGSLWCFGLLQNILSYRVEGVSVRIYLVDSEGNGLVWLDTPIARLSLWPGEESPYGGLFETIPNHYVGAVAELYAAKAATEPEGSFRLPITIENTSQNDAALKIWNATEKTAPESRIILTLLNPRGQVVGYRIGLLGHPLEPGENSLLTLPTGAVEGMGFTLRVSAESVELASKVRRKKAPDSGSRNITWSCFTQANDKRAAC